MAQPSTSPSSHFFFFAARPPKEIADQMAEAWSLLGTGERLRYDKLHMTILPVTEVADIPEGLVAQLAAAGEAIDLHAFPIEFDRLATWRHGRARNNPLVLTNASGRCPPAEAVAAALLAALPEELHWPVWRLVPHVTLAYGKGFAEPLPLPRPIRWLVDSITLTESLRGRARHIPVASWSLRHEP